MQRGEYVMMEIKTEGQNMVVQLVGEIDHHSAGMMRQQIDARIQSDLPKRLYLDFSGVTFMDSSGVGLIMGRYRSMNLLGGTVLVKNAGGHLLRVMRLAGLERLVRFE